MKSRIIGVLLAGMSFLSLAAPGQAETVVISGRVTLPAGVLTPEAIPAEVHALVSGLPAALTGDGFDSGTGASALGPAPKGGAALCRFPLAGARTGNVITVSGTVVFSPNPAFIGTPVTITANAATESIIFVFGPLTLTGTGQVVIAP
jgi:hypothetical protein